MFSTSFDDAGKVAKKQQAALIQRGFLEAELMAPLQGPILSTVYEEDLTLPEIGRVYAEVLRREGVVRIDGVFEDDEFTDALRASVLTLKEQAEDDVSQNRVPHQDRFAKCLLSDNRCDLLLPLESTYLQAAKLLLASPVGSTLECSLGPEATLYELACLISSPGASRQNVHPDHPCLDVPGLAPQEPLCVSCFVALHDIDLSMGPTVWIPRTQDRKSHDCFRRIRVEDVFSEVSPKDELLRTRPSKVGLIPKGAAVLFDSRLLHCGGSNTSENQTRALFYFTFKNPKVGFPGNTGSLGYGLKGDLELRSLRDRRG